VQAADPETTPSVLWFAAIQSIKREQDLADLACVVSGFGTATASSLYVER
jgi:hypothetical protein